MGGSVNYFRICFGCEVRVARVCLGTVDKIMESVGSLCEDEIANLAAKSVFNKTFLEKDAEAIAVILKDKGVRIGEWGSVQESKDFLELGSKAVVLGTGFYGDVLSERLPPHRLIELM